MFLGLRFTELLQLMGTALVNYRDLSGVEWLLWVASFRFLGTGASCPASARSPLLLARAMQLPSPFQKPPSDPEAYAYSQSLNKAYTFSIALISSLSTDHLEYECQLILNPWAIKPLNQAGCLHLVPAFSAFRNPVSQEQVVSTDTSAGAASEATEGSDAASAIRES